VLGVGDNDCAVGELDLVARTANMTSVAAITRVDSPSASSNSPTATSPLVVSRPVWSGVSSAPCPPGRAAR
jgi:hypothetical protein